MTYSFLSPALAELTEAAEYYDEQLPGLGADFIQELDSAITRILNFPEAWGRISENYRHCNLRRFPYSIIYKQVNADEILIVAVFHQSREPKSWKENL